VLVDWLRPATERHDHGHSAIVLGRKMVRSWIGILALLGCSACSTSQAPVEGRSNPCPVPGSRPGGKCDLTQCPPRPARWSHKYWEQPMDCTERERNECELNEELRSFVATRRSCTVAADCSIVLPACPFGCGIPVAAKYKGEVWAKVEELSKRVRFPCAYTCHPTSRVACDEGSCVDATPDCLPNQMLQLSGANPQ
jgi:hypothetical protein